MIVSMNDQVLFDHFGSRLQQYVPLANLTTARVGGKARYFLVVHSADELAADVSFLWSKDYPIFILGNGSNLLISDSGLDAVVIHNKAKAIRVDETPSITAESGANLGTIARQAALHALTGLEWASTIPGTLGGAVYGNAGAHGGEMSRSLILANILHRKKGQLSLTSEQMAFGYRSSVLKRDPGNAVVLSAQLKVLKGDAASIKAQMDENSAKRRNSQPPGASMGSMFKNPEGDYAGRLIESVGLKGKTIGGVQISPVHANFMINNGSATAEDIHRLILLVQKTVQEKTGVHLELEVELLGKWQD